MPLIQGKCSLVSSKVSYGTQEGTCLEERWLQICQKRDECDEAVKKIKGMAFFPQQWRLWRKKGHQEEPEDEEKEEDHQKM